ncbi:MAG: type II toxin-antitoxin system prevent-host-death family antitoxin [Acidobacteriota bacterium]|nr:MAG: type II toxin-antitoxin system prevent-host-death family antitoxin [Acidobacteriota bacterium]
MQQIELNEAKLHLAELINEAIKGQEIIITENNQPLLKLVRIAYPKTNRTLGSAEGQVWIAPDFNESYEDWFEEWEKDPI